MTSKQKPIILWPYCSLSRKGAAILFMVLGCAGLSLSMAFYLLGAWPVIGFFGVELGLLFLFFHLHHRSTEKRFERITKENPLLRIERSDGKGRISTEEMPLAWLHVRLESEDMDNLPDTDRHFINRHRLYLTGHGKKVEVGDFLPYQEKPELAEAITRLIEEPAPAQTNPPEHHP
ncbi:MAG: DUF2244 domain-containing protein [Candidatus Puniceispirillales bacterium]|nr:DUF2244 domain-containing protein [Pseudomonadota bacterium]